MIPEVEEFVMDMMFGVAIVLVLTGFLLIVWIYRGIMGPLNKMRVAARRIQTGDLDFEIPTEADDELGPVSYTHLIIHSIKCAKSPRAIGAQSQTFFCPALCFREKNSPQQVDCLYSCLLYTSRCV